jgi:hypothetical protein
MPEARSATTNVTPTISEVNVRAISGHASSVSLVMSTSDSSATVVALSARRIPNRSRPAP